MAESEFQVEAIGEVYAQALVNLAEEHHVLDAVVDDVHSLGELLNQNKLLADFFHAVTISPEEKIQAVERIFQGRMNPLTIETLKSMARRDRLMFVRGLIAGLDEILTKMRGETAVEVTSALELSPELRQKLQGGVDRALAGQTAEMTVTIDPKLIGGVRVQVGDTLIDGSVATQLRRMREHLKSRGMIALQEQGDLVAAG